MKSFDYSSATTAEDVLPLLTGDGDGAVRPLAGGTDLLTLIKADITAPAHLVDIKRIADLAGIRDGGGEGLTLGALTTLTELETHSLIAARFPVLAQAAAAAATPQLRNMATVGGNLLQRSRCWYFRSSHFHCWLKGGDTCPAVEGENRLHAILGGDPCWSAHPSDIAPALLALDAELRLRGPAGVRTVPLAGFFALPEAARRTETLLGPDELIEAVHIPRQPDGARGTYLKAMDRKIWAFALSGVAAVVATEQGRVTHARLALAGVAPIPWRATSAEATLAGKPLDDAAIARAAGAAVADAAPLRDNGYKVQLTRALVRRALSALAMHDGSG